MSINARKPGRPKNPPKPEDFGTELTFDELGQCLGISRYRAKVLVIDNGLPTITRGKFLTVHRAVAELLVSGDWWLGNKSKQEAKEVKQDEPISRPDVRRGTVDVRKLGPVHDFVGSPISGRSVVGVGGKA